MPEMRFRIRWPDGSAETCYSPSLVIKDYFAVGADYPLADFLERSRTALGIASERVRAKYGMPCRRALAQLSRIEAAAGAFTDQPGARVAVDGFDAYFPPPQAREGEVQPRSTHAFDATMSRPPKVNGDAP